MNNLIPVKILVNGNGKIVVLPDPVHISECHGDQVVWECSDGVSFEIHFKPGRCPFSSRSFTGGSTGGIVSPLCLNGSSSPDPYKYDVVVTFGNGSRAVADPELIVDP